MERTDWNFYFETIFNKLKAKAQEIYPSDDEDEVSPNTLALRKALLSLPCPVKLIKLKADPSKIIQLTSELCFLIRYDFAHFGDSSVEYYGSVDTNNPNVLAALLTDKLGLPPDEGMRFAEKLCQGQRIIATFFREYEYLIHCVFYDIEENPEEYISTSYEGILDFCYKRKGWNIRQIEVNGERFPSSFSHLVDWLVKKRVIKKWEEELFKAALGLRNYLSHLEHPPTLTPSSGILKITANYINRLYHEV